MKLICFRKTENMVTVNHGKGTTFKHVYGCNNVRGCVPQKKGSVNSRHKKLANAKEKLALTIVDVNLPVLQFCSHRSLILNCTIESS